MMQDDSGTIFGTDNKELPDAVVCCNFVSDSHIEIYIPCVNVHALHRCACMLGPAYFGTSQTPLITSEFVAQWLYR